jgi:heme-degrading monooxygenase HmoA
MIKVFFIAKMKSPMPSEYLQMSKKMRELAEAHPGFIDITSEEIGDVEITVSSWRSKEDVMDWAHNPEHMEAKKRSKEWYEWVRGIHVEAVDEKR